MASWSLDVLRQSTVAVYINVLEKLIGWLIAGRTYCERVKGFRCRQIKVKLQREKQDDDRYDSCYDDAQNDFRDVWITSIAKFFLLMHEPPYLYEQ
jgi:hypothetical protein